MESIKRPFRLGTTSFIYPDHIIPNVRKIGGLFDEIELLVFESLPGEVVPSKEDVAELKGLARDLNLTYNIHLPVDVSLTSDAARDRQFSADTLNRVLERFAPLSPTSHTLHLDMDRDTDLSDPDQIRAWEDRARHGLDLLAPSRPEEICIETLWYDPVFFEAMVRDYDLSVCADLGHHFKYGYDPARTFDMFGDRIRIVHLHGVDMDHSPPKDHTGLDRLPDALFGQAAELLKPYTGTVSIEVFGLAQLKASLNRLSALFPSDIPLL